MDIKWIFIVFKDAYINWTSHTYSVSKFLFSSLFMKKIKAKQGKGTRHYKTHYYTWNKKHSTRFQKRRKIKKGQRQLFCNIHGHNFWLFYLYTKLNFYKLQEFQLENIPGTKGYTKKIFYCSCPKVKNTTLMLSNQKT